MAAGSATTFRRLAERGVPPRHEELGDLVSRADIQRATTRVEARLGSPDGYQTFDTGTNQNIGTADDGPPAGRFNSGTSARGKLRFVFNEDGSCDAAVESA